MTGEIMLFPNPTNGEFLLKTPSQKLQQVEIFSSEGRLVWFEKFKTQQNSQTIKFNAKPGIYFIRINEAVWRKIEIADWEILFANKNMVYSFNWYWISYKVTWINVSGVFVLFFVSVPYWMAELAIRVVQVSICTWILQNTPIFKYHQIWNNRTNWSLIVGLKLPPLWRQIKDAELGIKQR